MQGRFLSNGSHQEWRRILSYRSRAVSEYGIGVAERLELLTNRCLVVAQKDETDFWPYDDHVTLRAKSEWFPDSLTRRTTQRHTKRSRKAAEQPTSRQPWRAPDGAAHLVDRVIPDVTVRKWG